MYSGEKVPPQNAPIYGRLGGSSNKYSLAKLPLALVLMVMVAFVVMAIM